MINQITDTKLFRQQCFFNGIWQDADSGSIIDVYNPANDTVLGAVPKMGSLETQRAIDSAHHAFQSWKETSAQHRSSLLRRLYELILENREDLALILTLEQGKPLLESHGEVNYAASFLEWNAEESKRIYGDMILHAMSDKRSMVLKQPVGVVSAVTPWNFPLAMIVRKAGPALAAGCTVVLKASELTPFSAFAVAELANRAGIPAGVFNVITGDAAAIGTELSTHINVKKLTFTGSTSVGKLLMQQCASNIKNITLELGGNAPFLVFDDADIDAAVDGLMIAKFRNTGQTCISANRILVHTNIQQQFIQKLATSMGRLKVGNGLDDQCDQGPLINRAALDKIDSLIADAVSKGASIIMGGTRHELGGNYYQPTLLSGVTPQMQIAHEEIFGPIAAVFAFNSEEQAIQLANDTPYGLASYFYTPNINRIWRVTEALEAGIVAVNTGRFASVAAPFGGIKQSGIGREGSKYGIEEYLEIKTVCFGGL